MRDLLDYRSEFPILEHTTYLINHSLAAMPAKAEERLAEYARMWKERGIRSWGEGWWDMPVTIARLNVPYGDNGGWPAFHLAMIEADQPVPIHPERPNRFNPIHEDDIIRMIPRLLEIASVPATTVNWGGSETAGIEEWSIFLGEIVGHDVTFVETEQTVSSVVIDPTKMHELVGHTEVDWRDGMRRMVDAQRRAR